MTTPPARGMEMSATHSKRTRVETCGRVGRPPAAGAAIRSESLSSRTRRSKDGCQPKHFQVATLAGRKVKPDFAPVPLRLRLRLVLVPMPSTIFGLPESCRRSRKLRCLISSTRHGLPPRQKRVRNVFADNETREKRGSHESGLQKVHNPTSDDRAESPDPKS